MCAWRPFGPPPPPLPPLLAPDIVAQGSEKAYLAKILAESRSVLDADLAEFERLGGRPDALVYRKPVSNAKGVSRIALPSRQGDTVRVAPPPPLPPAHHATAAAACLPPSLINS